MKILILVKRVIGYNVKARVRTDGSGVDLTNVNVSMAEKFKGIYWLRVFDAV